MPPSAVKTVNDVIYWQYAKLISNSAKFGKANYGFVMSKFKELQSGKISWSTTTREWLREHENPNECIYCGSKENLTTEHILPKSRGGPDIPDNVIKACRKCNLEKGSKRMYEWKGLENINEHSRIAEGKYLKLLYKLHKKRNTLNISDTAILCPKCDMSKLCKKADKTGKLTVYCLEGCFLKQ